MKIKIEKPKKNQDYFVIPTNFLNDCTLSLKSKGLLAHLYSMPTDWKPTILSLCEITNAGIASIRSSLAELEQKGYLKREKYRDKNGQFQYKYEIVLE